MSESWLFGRNMFDVDFGFHVDSVKQKVKNNPVNSGHVSHRRTSFFTHHFQSRLRCLQRCTTETHFTKNVCLWAHCPNHSINEPYVFF